MTRLHRLAANIDTMTGGRLDMEECRELARWHLAAVRRARKLERHRCAKIACPGCANGKTWAHQRVIAGYLTPCIVPKMLGIAQDARVVLVPRARRKR